MRCLLVLVLVATATTAHAATLTGLVYRDANGDGVPNPDEPGVANAIVAYDTQLFTTTNAAGEFSLTVPDPANGILWVRVPDGYRPGPVWSPASAASHDLGLVPFQVLSELPLTFVVAADAHMAPSMPFTIPELTQITEAAAAAPNASFFTIVGDITQGGTADEFAQVDQALAGLGVPYVPVPGNHDWYDGGTAYHAHYGPDNYSFDLGGVHFVVWNLNLPVATVHAYLGTELSHVAPGMPIVALTHMPPAPEIIDELRDLGVSLVITGHTHTNRMIDHDGVIELNTEPLQMGGLDFTPAGYRVISLQQGSFATDHHASVDPHLALVSPADGQCVDPRGGTLVVAAELDAGSLEVSAAIDCSAPTSLARAGAWDWSLAIPALTPGPHSVALDATSSSGAHETVTAGFLVCRTVAAPAIGGDWPQPGGDATHAGVAAKELAPPLVTRWTTPLAGHVLTAAPVIAQGRVFVSTSALGDADEVAGLVALDLATGQVLWKAQEASPIRGAPAVLGSVVAVARVDGTVLGFDAATGTQLWSVDLGEDLTGEQRSIYAAPAADGAGFVIGNQRALASIDPSGAVQWQIDPVPDGVDSQSAAAVAIADGVALGAFNRGAGGLGAWDRSDGTELWRLPAAFAVGVNASPVIGDDGAGGHVAYVVNGETEVRAVDLATGTVRWVAKLDPAGFDWGNATVGAPALAGDTLIVPTLYSDLVALDTQTGLEQWRFGGEPSLLRTTHYRGSDMAGFAAAPVVTGDIVWAADTSGVLYAIDLRSGQLLWQSARGEPILSGLAVSGDWLVTATFDGTVHAFVHTSVENPPILVGSDGCTAMISPDDAGCCDARGGGTGALLLALGVGLCLARGRRARS
ncbi:MAG TPA: PQQ-binding-like beta-propeller repeat protein [Kofleriaceae bacterium]